MVSVSDNQTYNRFGSNKNLQSPEEKHRDGREQLHVQHEQTLALLTTAKDTRAAGYLRVNTGK